MARDEDIITGLEEEDDEDAQKDRYLTFKVGTEEYGIEIKYVIEIIGIQNITEVPDMPEYVKGVINLRGKVIPVMDVRLRFGLESREYDDRTCVVVINNDETDIGLVVDTVHEVINIPEENVSPPPKVKKDLSGKMVRGMGRLADSVKILLDLNKLLNDLNMSQMSDMEER